MNLTSSVRVAYETLRSLSSTSITTNYVMVGTVFQNPVRMILIHNPTNQNLLISYDGIDDNSFIAATSSRVLDYGSNMAEKAGLFEQPAYQGVWIKAENTLPTNGTVYVEVVYASQS